MRIAGDILASEDALKAVLEHMKPQQKASLWQRLKRALTSLRDKLKGKKNAKPAETQLNVLERLYKQAFAQRVIQDAVENPRVGNPGAVSESDAEGVTRMNSEKTQVSSEKEKTPEREKAEVGENKSSSTSEAHDITIEDIIALRKFGRKSVNELANAPDFIRVAEKWARKFYSIDKLGTKSPFFRAWFGEWRAHSNQKVNIITIDKNTELKAGKAINADTGKVLSWNAEMLKESTLNASKEAKPDIEIIGTNISKLVESAILLDTAVSIKSSKRKLEGTAFMHSFYGLIELNNKHILVKMYAEEALSPKSGQIFSRAYSLKYIEKVAEFDNGVHLDNESLTESPSTTTYSIADLYGFVKRFDKEFSPAPEVSKAVLNPDGTLKVFYHGVGVQRTVLCALMSQIKKQILSCKVQGTNYHSGLQAEYLLL